VKELQEVAWLISVVLLFSASGVGLAAAFAAALNSWH
jgi:hypothetical protein